jgi:N-acetylglucosaminyldiphosphoundecaprenol N-acetyl-beta-D-mannosaminyltransferase
LIWGGNIAMLNIDRICKDTAEFMDARVVTFLNPYSFLKIAESGIDLKYFDKICIDGIALKIYLKLVYRNLEIQRLSFDFTSVAQLIFKRAVDNSERGFILGSDQNSNDEFLKRISDMFPGINIDGRSGYFENSKESSDYLRSLAASDYEFIVVGMGAVKQETTINTLVDCGYKGRIYTCGGFIHQTAMGGGHYYPSWVDSCNLRFAYRMLKEPSTIRRYLIDYPKAFFLLTRNIEKFKH